MNPIISAQNVILRLKLGKFVKSEDGVDEVILSRFNGNSFVELSNGRVVSNVRIQQPITVAHQLSVFYSYQPKYKHYLFINGSDLVVLRKSKGYLGLHKTYNKVVNVYIKDHLNVGKPQVVIHLSDDLQPIITDFNTENNFNIDGPKQVQAFAPLVQKSKLRIKNAEKVVAEKTKILSKLSATLAFNCNDDKILTTADKLVYLRESLMTGDVGLPAKSKALSVGKPWFKIHLKKWIIGFPVVNVSKDDIYSLEMYISHQCITVKKSLLFIQKTSESTLDIYQESLTLFKDQSGILVAVMEEPYLIPQTFVLNSVCCFENCACGESVQCYLGAMEIITSELASDNYRLSWTNRSTEDLIAIQAASTFSELSFQLLNIELSEFQTTVELVLSLKKISGNVLLPSRLSGAQSCLLMVFDEYSDNIMVYTDTINDFILLVHKLMESFRGAVLFKHPNSNPMRAVEAIKKEIAYIKDVLVRELMESDGNCSSTVNIKEQSRDLMVLEIESAVEINLLKIYSTL